MAESAEFLFPLDKLKDLLNSNNSKYDIHESDLLSRNLRLRPLHKEDFSKGYLDLLAQHTKVGDVSAAKFAEQFQTMQAYKDIYYIVVIEDLAAHKIVATGTLEIEHKFIHSAALRGRIEDVVVDREASIKDYRYSQGNLAAVIMDVVTTMGKVLGCYKISLESEDNIIKFYEKFGYKVEPGQNYMAVRYRS
ncbi:glucosamine 6-phosphate N-acetyltransferase-like [Paramacrobiotus metropolitanus]|uniref:glucosamine 6-phosphate N-acetyltransferase-like n=1 Tax=Paramacrobiotus metropolitanus TaxID=2943436 RepID=UPI0024456317|nr:glucosamine 6-phosphate N-acetyltransferase-like [Paramacrobiotus metropolitanus]